MFHQILTRFITFVKINSSRATARAVLIVVAVIAYGAFGFVYFEREISDSTLLDGLWYTLVTMTTTGYGDLFPKTTPGRFVVGVPLMVIGIGIFGYLISTIAAAIVLAQNRKHRGMGTSKMTGHIVIVNTPSIRKVEQVIRELRRDPSIGSGTPVVIISEDLEELPSTFIGHNVQLIRGNPTTDDTLARANIEKAKYAVVLCRDTKDSNSDNLNLAITLAIEAHNPDAITAVECVDPEMESLLHKAKCDRVVCLSKFESRFVSHELLNPGSQAMIEDLLCSSSGQQLYVTAIDEKMATDRYSTLRQFCAERRHVLIGIQRAAVPMLNPPDDTRLQSGDSAVTIGESRLFLS